MKTKIQKINIQTAALSTAALLGLISPTLAQNVSISPTGNAPDNSAALDIRDFTDKGLLIPRIALTGPTDVTTISSPALSLLVYNTGTGGLTPAGYYYWDGSRWVRLVTMGGTPSDAWLTLGNAGTNSGLHFIGTTDNRSLRFRTNNVHRMVIDSTGNVGIGTTAPDTKLSIIGGRLRVGEGNPSDGYIRLGTTKGSIIGTNGGASVNYNGLWLGVNETNPNIQADMTLPSWAVDIGGFDNITFPGTSDAFRVARKPAGGSYSEFMRITNSGNVGIGTTSPSTKLYVKGRGRAEYGWDIVCKDTTLPASANTNDLGTIINNLLSIYDCVYLYLPQNSTWTWNNTVTISNGKQLLIYGLGHQNGAANITATVNVTNANTYTHPLCNGGNPSKNVAIARILSGALSIYGIVLNANYCDTRPYGCSTYHQGLFCLYSANNFVNRVGHSQQVLTLSQMYIYSNEPVVSIGQWARAEVFFGHTYFYRANPACVGSLNAVQYDYGTNFSGGKAIISTSHTTLGAGVNFQTSSHLEYQGY